MLTIIPEQTIEISRCLTQTRYIIHADDAVTDELIKALRNAGFLGCGQQYDVTRDGTITYVYDYIDSSD